MIIALALVTNLISKGNKLCVEVKGLTDSRKERPAEALATFTSVDNARALVTMGELARFKEVHKVVLPSFSTKRTKTRKSLEVRRRR